MPEEEKRKVKSYKLPQATIDEIERLRQAWGEKSDSRVIERAIREVREQWKQEEN